MGIAIHVKEYEWAESQNCPSFPFLFAFLVVPFCVTGWVMYVDGWNGAWGIWGGCLFPAYLQSTYLPPPLYSFLSVPLHHLPTHLPTPPSPFYVPNLT